MRNACENRVCDKTAGMRLAEQLQSTLRQLVRLCEHRLRSLVQDGVPGVLHHFLGNVGVADGGLSVSQVLGGNTQVVDRMLQTVLNGTEVAARSRDLVDRILDRVHDEAEGCEEGIGKGKTDSLLELVRDGLLSSEMAAAGIQHSILLIKCLQRKGNVVKERNA